MSAVFSFLFQLTLVSLLESELGFEIVMQLTDNKKRPSSRLCSRMARLRWMYHTLTFRVLGNVLIFDLLGVFLALTF